MAIFRKQRFSGLTRWLLISAVAVFLILLALAIWFSRHQIFQIFAHELLIETHLRPSRLVRIGGPEPAGVGRQRLVDQHD